MNHGVIRHEHGRISGYGHREEPQGWSETDLYVPLNRG